MDNRKYQRKDRQLQFEIKLDIAGFDLIGETKNISYHGLLYQAVKPIPEMTTLKILLKLPDDYVECEGTVVRVEKSAHEESIYNTAIFFHNISEAAKQKIMDYLET
ncbi:MAG: PilZ domain-containing protein [Deltaproteobacteria bacterium]|nr:PilZ domain-containing protein [Deltaproteobacteria bacterium]